ncbi:GGDEF domain-containing protein [Aminipila butyrica]|uniref:GGDEF domain-containing protein n=1 Tax=Aminipila butyrica TaxID=433296 RepID=A0A858BZH6_9FIRM|nr:GGDEF domain-containing protein [Aminipila butyrica]QIB70144.1 GGDEF domain-containing protein [Aminipila butyrica]
MVENEEKFVLVCEDRAFLKVMTETFGDDYLVESAEILKEEQTLEKYRRQVKLIVEAVPSSEKDCAFLEQKLRHFQTDEMMAFVLTCRPGQKRLAAKMAELEVADILFLPCEETILRKRIGNIIKLMFLKKQALRDPLTKAYNRRGFEKLVQKLLRERLEKAAFIMIDLDDFKRFNDQYGHHMGDQVLTGVVGTLEQVLDREDVVGRMGGDEFAIFIPHVGSPEAFHQKLSLIFRQLEIQWLEEEDAVQVLSSMGISFFPEHGQNFEELYRRADEAQYRSKADGKHRIRIYGE